MASQKFAYVNFFPYLCCMKKDDIIALLGEQLKATTEQLKTALGQLKEANAQVSALTATVGELTARIESLEKMLTEKGVALDKMERISKALGNMVSGKKSERQKTEEDKAPMTMEEYQKMLEQRAAKRKARGNNNARRDEHLELETVYVDVEPEVPGDTLATLRLIGVRECTRYSMIPPRFLKTVYRIKSYTNGSTVYQGSTPRYMILNSTYDASVVAGLMELRYVYSMPVERIISYYREHGFVLHKPTAHKLLKGGSAVLKQIYKAMEWTVKQQDYICMDETYHKVLTKKESPGARGSKKAYIWGALAPLANLFFMWYDDGSRSEDVLIEKYGQYRGFLQSDAFTGYKKLESDDYPDITRIPCLQHIKRGFIECGENDRDAQRVVGIINEFYRKDRKHVIGEKGWTTGKHLEYRQKYAPDILLRLRNELESMRPVKEHLPKSDLGKAVGYALNEYDAICDIFKRGDTALDNNAIERCNRYVSLSRRNSLFFGSHKGAEAGCILYTIAISCRLNGVNLFEYIKDVVERTAGWPEDTPLENYRNLLPDKWTRNQ